MKPQAFVEKSSAVFQDTVITYNQAGYTYNQTGDVYGGSDRVQSGQKPPLSILSNKPGNLKVE